MRHSTSLNASVAFLLAAACLSASDSTPERISSLGWTSWMHERQSASSITVGAVASTYGMLAALRSPRSRAPPRLTKRDL